MNTKTEMTTTMTSMVGNFVLVKGRAPGRLYYTWQGSKRVWWSPVSCPRSAFQPPIIALTASNHIFRSENTIFLVPGCENFWEGTIAGKLGKEWEQKGHIVSLDLGIRGYTQCIKKDNWQQWYLEQEHVYISTYIFTSFQVYIPSLQQDVCFSLITENSKIFIQWDECYINVFWWSTDFLHSTLSSILSLGNPSLMAMANINWQCWNQSFPSLIFATVFQKSIVSRVPT